MRNFTEEEKQLIVELYVNQKRGQFFVCKQVHTSPKALKNFLRENGYEIRNFSQAATESNLNRASQKNELFFKTESPDMAWLLGFLAADGCIRKDTNEIKIGLCQIDREILEKIKVKLELETNIKDYTTSQGYCNSTLSWSCKEHKEDLAKYEITYDKTFKEFKRPIKLDKKYHIDYIRGYFDGDGSVNLIQGKNLRWQVCSATPDILKFILETLEEYGIPRVNIQKTKRNKHDLYYIQYSTNSTKKIYNILYTPNALCLARKKKHFDEIIKMK